MAQNQKQLIDAINNLYIIRRNKYLKQTNGSTYEIKSNETKVKADGKTFKTIPLIDSFLIQHLRGKATYGVFASNRTKFIVFDFDYKDDWNACKWYCYKIRDALIELGIPANCIYAFFSGGKGIHLTLYFESPLSNKKAKAIYDRALYSADLIEEKGKIEYRPTENQGIKMPLGLHYTTRKKAHFIDIYDLDRSLDDDTILSINKVPNDCIDAIFDDGLTQYDFMTKAEIEEAATTEIRSKVEKLDIYKLLEDDEQYQVDYLHNLYQRGFTYGTRHNSTLKLATFFKSYYKYDQETTTQLLIEWLDKHDKALYDCTYEFAVDEIKRITRIVFEHDYKHTFKKRDIYIKVDELRTVLSAKKSANKHFTTKQKLVLFALLVHSKYFCDSNKRTFYMTYNQITDVTGITNRGCLIKTMNELEQSGLIKVHDRNQKQHDNTYLKKPNVYEVLFADYDVQLQENKVESNTKLDRELFNHLIKLNFNKSELKTMMLPRRQYEHYNQLLAG